MTIPPHESAVARRYTFRVGPGWAGRRLDRFVAAQDVGPGLSRTGIKRLCDMGMLRLNGVACKPGRPVRAGDLVELRVPPPETSRLAAEKVDFTIIHEDSHILVIDKPAGLVVHPAPGHADGTLVNGLLHHLPRIAGVGDADRPGIVHRLDRDTSGVMVVARTGAAHQALSARFAGREVEKEYLAVLEATPPAMSGTVDRPIGRHPVRRKKMAVVERGGRRAVTHWRVKETFASGFCLVSLALETGRTHQIRVHMASVGAPVAGDLVYGGRRKGLWPALGIGRQMLHAVRLAFVHPASGAPVAFEAPMPADMRRVLGLLGGEG